MDARPRSAPHPHRLTQPPSEAAFVFWALSLFALSLAVLYAVAQLNALSEALANELSRLQTPLPGEPKFGDFPVSVNPGAAPPQLSLKKQDFESLASHTPDPPESIERKGVQNEESVVAIPGQFSAGRLSKLDFFAAERIPDIHDFLSPRQMPKDSEFRFESNGNEPLHQRMLHLARGFFLHRFAALESGFPEKSLCGEGPRLAFAFFARKRFRPNAVRFKFHVVDSPVQAFRHPHHYPLSVYGTPGCTHGGAPESGFLRAAARALPGRL